jgi:hypothetical protein
LAQPKRPTRPNSESQTATGTFFFLQLTLIALVWDFLWMALPFRLRILPEEKAFARKENESAFFGANLAQVKHNLFVVSDLRQVNAGFALITILTKHFHYLSKG